MPDPRPPDRPSVAVKGNVLGSIITGDRNTLIFGSFSKRQQRAIWSVLLAILIIGSATIMIIIGDRDEKGRPPPVRTGAYTVLLRGSAFGGATFDQQGELRIRDSSSHPPYEWCLKVGNPWGAPAYGALWFGTVGTCFDGGLDETVARIQEKDGETRISPDASPSAPGQSGNSFTATSGLASGVYIPDRGEVRFRASGSKLEGTISLQGLQGTGESSIGIFTATLNASLVSDDPEAVISSPVQPVPYGGPTDSTSGKGGAKTKRYAIKTVVSFSQREGDPRSIKDARARFAGAVLVINTGEGGDFVYDPPGSRTDVFPVTGKVINAESVYILAGQRSSKDATTKAVVGGTLDLSGNEPSVRLTLTTTTTETTSYEAEAVLRELDDD
ncbi:hypothetical protein [Streptosporangium sp. NPDC000509]|uniref:hypothetical protein n=1 Tax=Streptosporangium sp. NPDC000509 TaxID=3366186 RepID=UPI0036C904E4